MTEFLVYTGAVILAGAVVGLILHTILKNGRFWIDGPK